MQKKNQKSKRAITGISMAILFLVVLTVSGFLYAVTAYAKKETLQGITKIVEETAQKDNEGNFKNPFVILEIVPDFIKIPYTVDGIDEEGSTVQKTVEADINIGSAGYYVKGQEPVTQNIKSALDAKADDGSYIFTDSESRKNIEKEIVNRDGYWLNVLINDSDQKAVLKNDTPAKYKELRLGEVMTYTHDLDLDKDGQKTTETITEATPEMMEALVEDFAFAELSRDYDGEDGAAYIDIANGVMEKVQPGDENGKNFVPAYDPLLTTDVGGNKIFDLNDNAYQFLTTGAGAGFALSDRAGEFDPYLVQTSEDPAYGAVFEYVQNVSSGYAVKHSSEKKLSEVAEGTPLYTYDGSNIFTFVGYANGGTVGPVGAKPDAEENAGTPEEPSEPTDGGANPGSGTGEPTDGSTNPGNETDEPTDGSANPGGGAGAPTDGAPGRTSGMSGKAGAYDAKTLGARKYGQDSRLMSENGNPSEVPGDNSVTEPADPPVAGDDNEPGDGDPTEGTNPPSEGEPSDGQDNPPADDNSDGTSDGSDQSSDDSDDSEFDEFEEDNTVYYVLQFQYVSNNTGGETLYQIVSYDKDARVKEFVINTTTEGAIVPNPSDMGHITLADDITAVKSRLVFDYKPGEGTYRWTSEAWLADAADSVKSKITNYKIRGAKIYYSTGLVNRDFFKLHVFDREQEECDSLPIVVKTIPANQVTEEDVRESKLLILHRGEPIYGPANGKTAPVYSKDGLDISYAVLKTVVERVMEEGYPVVSDYGMFPRSLDAKEDLSGESLPNVFYLTRALAIQDMDKYYDYILANDTPLTVNPLWIGTPSVLQYVENDNLDVAINHVNQSVYNVTYGTGPNGGFLNSMFTDSKPELGFEPVITDIQNENIYRIASGKDGRLDEIVSQATIIRYIIAYAQKLDFDQKGSLHILELEPCASYTLRLETEDNQSANNKKVKTLYKITSTYKSGADIGKVHTKKALMEFKTDKVSLTQMTTSEFIGRIEDINAHYDLIYIGSSIGPYRLDNGTIVAMNQDENGKTKYNNAPMDGLIYTGIGDALIAKNISVFNRRDWETTRFSGNDITEEKQRALQEFIDAGFPIIVSDDLVSRSANAGNAAKAPLVVNADTVDNSSFMYRFLDNNKARDNIFALKEVDEPLLNLYLNVGRPEVKLTEGSIAAQSAENVIQLSPDSTGRYRAFFEFGVNTVGIGSRDATYNCELFIDINADGKYSVTQEKIDQITLEDSAGNPVPMNEEGKYMMRSGGSYRATYILSSAHRGVIPWKIRVSQNGDSKKRSDVSGYYEIVDPDGELTKIHVLQIDTTSNHQAAGDKTPPTWNMEETLADENTWFYKLLKGKESEGHVFFDVSIDTIPGDLLTEDYTKAKLGEDDALLDAKKDGLDKDDFLEFFHNYDMIVIGFANWIQPPPNPNVIPAIKEFIEEGRSVLFTHDTTTSYTFDSKNLQDETKDSPFNTILRGTFGMDRYNIYNSRTEDGTFAVEKAWEPKSNRTRTVDERQAPTYPNLVRKRYNSGKLAYLADIGIDEDHFDQKYYNTQYVEQVNKGQITTYPYVLAEDFKITTTHSQYWQLDFSRDDDLDGESDVVVWYTLSGNRIAGRAHQDVYDVSPRDARNNYYIYNMGNVTYSGVGDNNVMGADGTGSESINEIKLFINTLIASYQAGLHDPEIRIIENYNPQSRDVDSFYLSYDEQLKSISDDEISAGVIDTKEDIYFVANSTSLVRTSTLRIHKMSAELYMEIPNVEGAERLSYKGSGVYAKRLKIESLHRMSADETAEVEVLPDEQGSYPIESGVVYKATVPISELRYYSDGKAVFDDADGPIPDDGSVNARNSKRIFVSTKETILNSRTGIETSPKRATDSIKAMRVRVFDMD